MTKQMLVAFGIAFLYSGVLFGAANTAQAANCDVGGHWTIRQSDGAVVEADIIQKDDSELIGLARFGSEVGRVTSGFIHNRNIILIIQFGHQGKYDGSIRQSGRIRGTTFDLATAGPLNTFATDQSFRCRK